MSPTGTIETSLGFFTFTMGSATHVYLTGDVVIFNVPYRVAYHCDLIDGEWKAKDWHEPYLSRHNDHKDPSAAARNKAKDVLSKTWTDYLAAHPGMSLDAEKASIQGEIDRLDGDISELKEKLEAKRDELTAAESRLHNLN
jgi:flagellar capping protein FliD